MATVDLSQLPQPQIIEVLDFEVILSEVKAVMLAAFPQEQQASVAAALARARSGVVERRPFGQGHLGSAADHR